MRLRQLFIIIITCYGAIACSSNQYRQCDGATWGTTYHIVYKSDRDLSDSIIATLKQVELSLSPFCDTSTISRINRNETLLIDTLVKAVFLKSQEVNKKSNGAFDPTVAPLINLWGFGYKKQSTLPTQAQIDSVMPFVGISECFLNDNHIEKKHHATEFNFSAITKGYGCDLIGEMFKRNQCEDFMIEIGGEIKISGVNSQKQSWHIMIDAPTDNDSSINHSQMAIIIVSDCGIATSGNYRNFKNTSIGKIGHTINPLTGKPVSTSTLSVTVIAPSAMEADALATACMAMPLMDAVEMIEGDCNISALFVTSDSISGKWILLPTSRFPLSEEQKNRLSHDNR